MSGLGEALRELVTVADTEEWEGKKQAWTGILDGELSLAAQIQRDSVGLKTREIEQAVIATFLHSQPIGQDAKTRDIMVLVGATRPDKIELEKGLQRWSQSSYWLDDSMTTPADGKLPSTWRLGNRPNLTQMHANAARGVSDQTVEARLIDEIGRTKTMVVGASVAGVKVHTLPSRPRDIEDDGLFHFAVLNPNAASESGKPSSEACKYLDETTGPEKPRVYRNALILLAPSRDGLEVARQKVREYLAWEIVNEEVKKQQRDGNVDPARAQTLRINIDVAKGRIPEAIRQAYCIVVTVSQQNENQAFKINVSDEAHFTTIKNDKRARIQDSAITPEAVLPDGPYSLWTGSEKSRRVKDLSGAFAQMPRLPKMLQASAILDTLASGCEQFTFVLRLVRPDGTCRTWWGNRPDDNAMADPALELVLPEAAELAEIPVELLRGQRLPGLWTADKISYAAIMEYFAGDKVVSIQRNGIPEPIQIPKATPETTEKAIADAVEKGLLWILSGPASLCGEAVPPGIINNQAMLSQPPQRILPAEILEENLTSAWKNGNTNGLSILTALSSKVGASLPWKTIVDVITDALHARFIELDPDSCQWPCDFPSAQSARFKVYSGTATGGPSEVAESRSNVLVAYSELDIYQLQDFLDAVPKLTDIKAKTGTALKFYVRIEAGDGESLPDHNNAEKINTLLRDIRDGWELR